MAYLGVITTHLDSEAVDNVLIWPIDNRPLIQILDDSQQIVCFQPNYLGGFVESTFTDNGGTIEILVLKETVNADGAFAYLYDMITNRKLKSVKVGADGICLFTGLNRSHSKYQVVISANRKTGLPYKNIVLGDLTPS